MRRTIDALSCDGSNCVGVVVGMIHGPGGGVEFAVREPEGVAREDAGGAVVDEGLVMQGMTRRVHAFEHAPGEFEALAVLRDRDTIARDGQDLAVQLRVQLVAVHGARRLDEFRRIGHVCDAARMQHRGGAGQRLHQCAGATGMVEMHVGQEQEIHGIARHAEFIEGGEDQRHGGVGPGIDDRGPRARHHDVGRIHLRPHVFGVDGRDGVGELRQAWHTSAHDCP